MGLRVPGFRPKKDRSGRALTYCAQCIKMRVPNPLQAVTVFSGEALCPTHLQNYAQFQFLVKDNVDYSYLEDR